VVLNRTFANRCKDQENYTGDFYSYLHTVAIKSGVR